MAIFLDVENLVHEHRIEEDWAGAAAMLRDAVGCFDERGIRVVQVAACDPKLSRELSDVLKILQFDTLVHGGGNDRADYVLLDQIKRNPRDAFDTLVIGSGDDIFSGAASDCVRDGKRVEVMAVRGQIGGRFQQIGSLLSWAPGKDCPPQIELPARSPSRCACLRRSLALRAAAPLPTSWMSRNEFETRE